MVDPVPELQGSNPDPTSSDGANIAKIQTLLKAKDDTQRFVGLALLKSLLDNSQQLRESEPVVQGLWDSLSSKFLDRLLRTGSKPSSDNAKEMLDLVVSILHIFAVLLPAQAHGKPKFTDRIPGLVGAVLYSSDETTILLLQLLQTLASSPEGAAAIVKVDDLSPLTEIAPSHAIVLDILCFAWLNAMTMAEDRSAFTRRVDGTIQNLAISFTGTDAVTFLEFLGTFLRQANSLILPSDPKWVPTAVNYIQHLVVKKPTPEARLAYTDAAASLLQTYPLLTPKLLFTDETKDEKPFPYLFINLLLVDIRASSPILLEQLNTPEYARTSRRLTSAFDVISIFIGHLVRSMEDETLESLILPADSLLKLRKTISETMSVTLEYLRDRWDASVAGAMGLHPDARASAAESSGASRHALAWDSADSRAEADPFILSAIRASALWLREDENDMLRKEATGLTDMLLELYQASSPERLDFRSATLVAFEALVTLDQGRELFLQHGGWQILSKDLVAITQRSGESAFETEASRGIEIVRVLLSIAEEESGGIPEDWMDLITKVAAWDVPSQQQSALVEEFQLAVLQLCCALLAKAGSGMRNRYVHSIGAIRGIAKEVADEVGKDSALRDEMEDVTGTLNRLAVS